MFRENLNNLALWHQHKHRKPLVLRGARQVGKSTLVRLFAKQQKVTLLEINLEQHRDLNSVFATLNVENIIRNIESTAGQSIQANTLLFLDEIQATPHALAALRYLYEERPDIPLIAAGSLLEFTLAEHSFSMPVGRIDYLHLGPMTFTEYLLAIDPFALEQLEKLNPVSHFPDKAHQRLKQHQRDYLLVGGMPEAVAIFKETKSFEEVQRVQNSICNTYQDDFAKYAQKKDLSDLQTLFRLLPTVIGNKIKYASLLPGTKSAYVKNLVSLLAKAQICSLVTRSACNGTPLRAEADAKFTKPIFLDVGLSARLLGIDWRDIENSTEPSLVNEGPLAEQFIGQHLHWDNQLAPELYYWARESKKSNAELDYVVTQGQLRLPIEVKSGKSGTLKSLHGFMHEKKCSVAIRFDLSPPSTQEINTKIQTAQGTTEVSYTLHSLPLYAVERLPALIEEIRKGTYQPNT